MIKPQVDDIWEFNIPGNGLHGEKVTLIAPGKYTGEWLSQRISNGWIMTVILSHMKFVSRKPVITEHIITGRACPIGEMPGPHPPMSIQCSVCLLASIDGLDHLDLCPRKDVKPEDALLTAIQWSYAVKEKLVAKEKTEDVWTPSEPDLDIPYAR